MVFDFLIAVFYFLVIRYTQLWKYTFACFSQNYSFRMFVIPGFVMFNISFKIIYTFIYLILAINLYHISMMLWSD